MKMGIEIGEIRQFIEYKPTDAVGNFVNTVTTNRRAADIDPTQKLKGDTLKLNGNSCYGGNFILKKYIHQWKFYLEILYVF